MHILLLFLVFMILSLLIPPNIVSIILIWEFYLLLPIISPIFSQSPTLVPILKQSYALIGMSFDFHCVYSQSHRLSILWLLLYCSLANLDLVKGGRGSGGLEKGRIVQEWAKSVGINVYDMDYSSFLWFIHIVVHQIVLILLSCSLLYWPRTYAACSFATARWPCLSLLHFWHNRNPQRCNVHISHYPEHCMGPHRASCNLQEYSRLSSIFTLLCCKQFSVHVYLSLINFIIIIISDSLSSYYSILVWSPTACVVLQSLTHVESMLTLKWQLIIFL